MHVVGLPGRLWRWRLRGGALPLADAVTSHVAAHGRPDVVVVSGLVDTAHLVGLARPALDGVPVVIYQHESQVAYPTADGAPDGEAVLRNWLSWCAADLVLFNSQHHLDVVLAAMPGFLAALPEPDHAARWEAVASRFEVLAVGVDLRGLSSAESPPKLSAESAAPLILWPHRWEADKDPPAFEAALAKLAAADVEFRLVLAGEDPDGGSTDAVVARRRVLDRFAPLVVAVGPFTDAEYRRWLIDADLVVSCARHEFFGIGVVEAVAAGCVPLLPKALSYPELIPEQWHEHALYEPGTFGSALVAAVHELPARRLATAGMAAAMQRFAWPSVAQRYDERLAATVAWHQQATGEQT